MNWEMRRQLHMCCTRKIFSLVIVLLAFCPSQASSQSSRLAFETATIKPSKSSSNAIGNRFGAELATWTNVSVRALIEDSYRLKDYLASAPDWVNTDKWDINARANGMTTFQQKMLMTRTLMEERCQLKFHMETRELPVYILTAVKGGPKFQPPKDDDKPAGVRIRADVKGAIIGHKMDVSTLPDYLSAQLNRPVIDKVGLKGIQDFTLEWTPVPNEGNFATQSDVADQPSSTDGPTIFAAIQEQLGLKLESARGPVQVLVIDSVQKPSEN
jgi:uncharacterized protein (TIGR03435 family)